MRILFIHNRYLQSAGGEDTTLDAEASLLASKGHEVRVQIFNNDELGRGLVRKSIAGLTSVYNRKSAKIVARLIETFKPDLVHVHNFYFTASPSVILAANRLKIPVVLTIHNYRLICANCLLLRDNKVCELCVSHDFPWYGVKYKCYHNSSVQSAMVGLIAATHKWLGTWKNRVDVYITPAEFSRNKLINSSLRLDPQKTKVKRNFIQDPGVGEPNKRDHYFLFVGRLSTEKGVHVLLEAMKMREEVHLIIVGDGPEEQILISKYGYLKNVTFSGKKTRPEVLELMKKSRALVFPSIWYEGLPVTIVESFATGTPVIASDLGAMSEMISDRKNGLLFDPGNANRLSAAITEFNNLTSDGNALLYQNARESYMQSYHPEKAYSAIMELYNLAIQTKNNSGGI